MMRRTKKDNDETKRSNGNCFNLGILGKVKRIARVRHECELSMLRTGGGRGGGMIQKEASEIVDHEAAGPNLYRRCEDCHLYCFSLYLSDVIFHLLCDGAHEFMRHVVASIVGHHDTEFLPS